ncbi:MAG: hypothetical protein ACKV22_26910 [Bryobacteraceae bacterium]
MPLKVAEKHGPSTAALSRHWQWHMRSRPVLVEIHAEAKPTEWGDPLVELARELREAARQIRVREEMRRPDAAVRAMVQERQSLALEQRMRQQRSEATWRADPKTAEFLRLVTKMLERHPETLQEFSVELKKLEREEAAWAGSQAAGERREGLKSTRSPRRGRARLRKATSGSCYVKLETRKGCCP